MAFIDTVHHMLSIRFDNILSVFRQISEVAGFLVRLCLRSLRLHLLTQISKWRHQQEQPKVAFYRSHKTAILISLPHVLPLTVAVSLILINTAFPRVFRNIGEDTTTTLQFLGKALEILIQGSIAAIVLDVIRRQALSAEGLPFGSLISYLRVTDISYLWSLELWGTITARPTRKRKLMLLTVFIAMMVVLANLVGPSGTTLLIPRAMVRDTQRVLLLLDNQTTLFPSTLTSGTLNENDFKEDAAQTVSLDWTRNNERPIADSHSTRDLFSYSTEIDNSATISIQSANNSTTVASVPGQQIAEAFPFVRAARGYQDVLGATLNTTSKQPYVRTKCLIDTYDQRTPTQHLRFSEKDADLDGSLTVSDILQYGNSDLIIHFANQSDVPQGKYSAVLAYGNLNETTTDAGIGTDLTLTTCTVETTWVNTSLGQSSSDRIQFSFDGYPNKGTRPELIQLTADWLEAFKDVLVINDDVVNTLTNYAIHENAAGWLLGRLFVMALGDSVSTTAPLFAYNTIYHVDAETSLSAYNNTFSTMDHFNQLKQWVKNNRLNDHYDSIVLVATPDWHSLDALTRQEMITYSPIHSYGCKPVTVKLSLAAIGLYCLVTMIYLLTVAWTGVTGHSWDSIGELLALALDSRRPEHLNDISVGIETLATYRELVSIRANEEDRLELMFHDDPGAAAVKWSDVEANRKY